MASSEYQIPEDKRSTSALEIFEGEPEPIEWLVKDLLPRGRLSQIVADSYDGKSRILEHITCSLAVGAPVFNRYAVPRPGRTLVSAPEDFIDAHRIFKMHAKTLGVELEEIAENVRLFEDHQMLTLEDEGWQRAIRHEIIEHEIDLFIVDPLQDHTAMNHNYQHEIGPVYDWLRHLSRSTGVHTFLSDHVNRRQDPQRRSHRQAGSQAGKKGKVDISWLLNPARGNNEDAILTYDKMKGLVLKDPDYLSRSVTQDEWYRIVARPLEERDEEVRQEMAEERILVLLNGADGPLNKRDLREKAKMDNRMAAKAVEGLIEKGHVDYERGAKNAKLHFITGDGLEALERGAGNG